MKLITHGITRWVILTRRWAIKFPSPAYKFRFFINGFLCNRDEVRKTKSRAKGICPVALSLFFGFIIIMPRCRGLKDGEAAEQRNNHPALKVGAECKEDSFGYNSVGELVAVDYADWLGRGDYKNGDWLVSLYNRVRKIFL